MSIFFGNDSDVIIVDSDDGGDTATAVPPGAEEPPAEIIDLISTSSSSSSSSDDEDKEAVASRFYIKGFENAPNPFASRDAIVPAHSPEPQHEAKPKGKPKVDRTLIDQFEGVLRIKENSSNIYEKTTGILKKENGNGPISKIAFCGKNSNYRLPNMTRGSYQGVVDAYNALPETQRCKETPYNVKIDTSVLQLKNLEGTKKEDVNNVHAASYDSAADKGTSRGVPGTLCVRDDDCSQGGLLPADGAVVPSRQPKAAPKSTRKPQRQRGPADAPSVPYSAVSHFQTLLETDPGLRRIDSALLRLDGTKRQRQVEGTSTKSAEELELEIKTQKQERKTRIQTICKEYTDTLNEWPRKLYWISAPAVGVDSNGGPVFTYAQVEVRSSPSHGGSGLFAKQNLKKGLIIPYLGHVIRDPAEVKASMSDKIFTIHDDEDVHKSVDGDPTQTECGGKLCVAAYANQASPGEVYSFETFPVGENFMSVFAPSQALFKILQEHQLADSCLVYILLRDVRVGEELFVSYNQDSPYPVELQVTSGFLQNYQTVLGVVDCLDLADRVYQNTEKAIALGKRKIDKRNKYDTKDDMIDDASLEEDDAVMEDAALEAEFKGIQTPAERRSFFKRTMEERYGTAEELKKVLAGLASPAAAAGPAAAHADENSESLAGTDSSRSSESGSDSASETSGSQSEGTSKRETESQRDYGNSSDISLYM